MSERKRAGPDCLPEGGPLRGGDAASGTGRGTSGPAVRPSAHRGAQEVLERLSRAHGFRFEAHWLDADRSFVTGRGEGRTTIRWDADQALVVDQRGQWRPRPGHQPVRFHGGYRWSVVGGGLAVAHLRRGEDQPVALVDLVAGPDGAWRSVRPFACGADEYSADLRVEGAATFFRWMVRGPRKAHTLVITYLGDPDASIAPEG